MTEWQPIETAPDIYNGKVDLWVAPMRDRKATAGGKRVTDCTRLSVIDHWKDADGGYIEWMDRDGNGARATHWMPPPDPPASNP